MAKRKPSQAGNPAAPNAGALLAQAWALFQAGQLSAAGELCRRVLIGQPLQLDALQLLGVVEFQAGRYASAAEQLQRAAKLAPKAAGLHCNLGLALQQIGRHEEALACYERALALQPDFAEALNNRANALRDLKRPSDAAASFERALRAKPDFPESLLNYGCLLIEQGQAQKAFDCLERCLRLVPQHAVALGQSGIALVALGRAQEGLPRLEQALRAAPGDAQFHYWRGNALTDLLRAEDAVAAYRQALQLDADVAEVHYSLGCTLLNLNRHDEALTAFDRAIQLKPGYVEALYNQGSAFLELGRHEDAIGNYQRLMELAPDHRYALGELFHARQYCCDWTHYAEDVRSLVASMADNRVRDMPFAFLAVADAPGLQLRCATAYTAAKYPTLPNPPQAGRRDGDRRIRVAYVSPDFREHPVAYLMAGLFESHDRQRFETVAIALNGRDDNAMGRRLAASFERFVDAAHLGDAEIASLMRELEIDIAVDLTGYTEGNRTAIFAHHAAPIQVNYLGYPGTMGAQYMDYIIADDFLIPETVGHHYAERVAYLPDCFQANDAKREIGAVPTRAAAGLPERGFVFCAFNQVNKFNPPMFDVWMKLLRTVPDSLLWLAADASAVRRNLVTEAARRGVTAERLVFSPRVAYADHLARLGLADLFLDTLPFNAGTTASDALWAGLPVLTCAGESFAARMAGSLLNAVGLPELITHSLDEYEALAVKLATAPDQLAEIRTRLAANRNRAPLFDTDRFRRYLEAAYLTMWQRQRRGEPPATFRVPAD